jgi:hypothetical protein
MMNTKQVKWKEERIVLQDNEEWVYTVHVMAERKPDGWEISEKEDGEIRWYAVPASTERLNKLETELRGQR